MFDLSFEIFLVFYETYLAGNIIVRVVHKSWCVVCVKDFTYSASGREEQKAAFP